MRDKVLEDFVILSDHLISARRLELVAIGKKIENLSNNGLCHSGWSEGKTERKRKEITEILQENWKTIQHESDGDSNCNWCTWYSQQNNCTETGRHGNKRRSGDHPNDSIIKINQNTGKSPGDLRRLAFTETSLENHQQTLVGKTLKGIKWW